MALDVNPELVKDVAAHLASKGIGHLDSVGWARWNGHTWTSLPLFVLEDLIVSWADDVVEEDPALRKLYATVVSKMPSILKGLRTRLKIEADEIMWEMVSTSSGYVVIKPGEFSYYASSRGRMYRPGTALKVPLPSLTALKNAEALGPFDTSFRGGRPPRFDKLLHLLVTNRLPGEAQLTQGEMLRIQRVEQIMAACLYGQPCQYRMFAWLQGLTGGGKTLIMRMVEAMLADRLYAKMDTATASLGGGAFAWAGYIGTRCLHIDEPQKLDHKTPFTEKMKDLTSGAPKLSVPVKFSNDRASMDIPFIVFTSNHDPDIFCDDSGAFQKRMQVVLCEGHNIGPRLSGEIRPLDYVSKELPEIAEYLLPIAANLMQSDSNWAPLTDAEKEVVLTTMPTIRMLESLAIPNEIPNFTKVPADCFMACVAQYTEKNHNIIRGQSWSLSALSNKFKGLSGKWGRIRFVANDINEKKFIGERAFIAGLSLKPHWVKWLAEGGYHGVQAADLNKAYIPPNNCNPVFRVGIRAVK